MRPSLCRSCDSNTRASTQVSPAEWSNHLVLLFEAGSSSGTVPSPWVFQPRASGLPFSLDSDSARYAVLSFNLRHGITTMPQLSLGFLSNLARIDDSVRLQLRRVRSPSKRTGPFRVTHPTVLPLSGCEGLDYCVWTRIVFWSYQMLDSSTSVHRSGVLPGP